MIIIISAPSGAGKSSIIKALLSRNDNLSFSISSTTRKMRRNEVHGRDYNFISNDEFHQLINEGKVIEYTQNFENMYGTMKNDIMKSISENKKVICDVDQPGARKMIEFAKENSIQYVSIWIDVNKDEIIRRLKNRGDNVEKRVKFINENYEMKYDNSNQDNQIISKIYQYTIKNENFEKALQDIQNIIRKHN